MSTHKKLTLTLAATLLLCACQSAPSANTAASLRASAENEEYFAAEYKRQGNDAMSQQYKAQAAKYRHDANATECDFLGILISLAFGNFCD
jgi:outer membrane PBP1 activator LpoA protein